MLRKTLFTLNEEEMATREGFGTGLVESAKEHPQVVAICADLTESTKMDAFKKAFPDRFFEVGITEQAMSGVASGMAAMGYKPFMASYAMFSPGRNWEQIRTTICYNNQPVTIVGAHAGISVGPDGATHQALEDIAIMRTLPNMTVLVPLDAVEAHAMTHFLATYKHPAYIRLGREKTPVMLPDGHTFNFGKATVISLPEAKHGKEFMYKVGVIGCGPIIYEALLAAKELEKEGIGVTVVNSSTVKPLDTGFLLRFAKDVKAFVTVEEAQIAGGLGSAIAEYMSEHHPMKVIKVGVQDRFGQSGKPKELYQEYNLTKDDIKQAIYRAIQ